MNERLMGIVPALGDLNIQKRVMHQVTWNNRRPRMLLNRREQDRCLDGQGGARGWPWNLTASAAQASRGDPAGPAEGNRADFLDEVFCRSQRIQRKLLGPQTPLRSIFKAKDVALKPLQPEGFRLHTKGDCLAVAVGRHHRKVHLEWSRI